ncbi:MAG: EAL domain-containing protein [Pyrinomonadaceae bacterium]
MIHSLVKRQLAKNQLDENTLPNEIQWQSFLERVSRTYTDADQERYLMERSLMISSGEMQDVYEQLRASETRYALAAEGANDGLWDWNLVTGEVYYSPRWNEIVGLRPEEGMVPSKNCWFDRVHADDRKTVIEEFENHLESRTKHFENEHRVIYSNGEYRWVLVRGLAVRNADGKALRIAGSLTDITERKRSEEQLAHDAVHDALTGLPNRKQLIKRIKRALDRTQYDKRYSFAVLFIDLDRFKTINDSLGHQAGDELLFHITKKLSSLTRERDLVARLGGDEFVIFIDGVSDPDKVKRVAERILSKLQKPTTIAGQKIYASASIGIAFGTEKYDTPDDLVRDADLAMYCAKIRGKGGYELFDAKLHHGAVSQLQIEIDLRRAVEHKEFYLVYQPIVSLDNERVVGFEALIRWHHPERGTIAPGDFIPIAEETGMILPIGKWVLNESCRQMSEWKRQFPDHGPMVMSVNLSAKQFEQADLVEEVARILRDTGLDPDSLKLEITESVIMSHADEAIRTVRQLREMGVRVSIDDFGTGYSSLSYLHRFPIDTLKVDRSFVSRIGANGENGEIIKTIIALANNLGLNVVAEGVENMEQLNFLKGISCSHGQGFYYSRPVDRTIAAEMFGATDVAETSTVSIPEHRLISATQFVN